MAFDTFSQSFKKDAYIEVVLVDENDHVMGVCEKLEAHKKRLLHRAFSVFIINEYGHMLIQKRAACKYHSPLKWANTCCGHPYLKETPFVGAVRRLQEELGFQGVSLIKKKELVYDLDVGAGLYEKEYVHVFHGTVPQASFQGPLNPDEVEEIRWISTENLMADMKAHPENYCPWFLYYANNHPDIFP